VVATILMIFFQHLSGPAAILFMHPVFAFS